MSSIGSQKFSKECTVSSGRLSTQWNGDSQSVCASKKPTYLSENSSSSWIMERKLCKCLGHATSPSPSYVWVGERLKSFPMMETSSRFPKHQGGRRVQDSMKYVQRFKTRWEDTACHQALLLVLEMLTVLDPPTCQGDLPSEKSHLDLRPFGVGVLVAGRKVMLWTRCCTEASKITLSIARVWLLQWVKEGVWEVLTHKGGDKGEGEFQVERDKSQLG